MKLTHKGWFFACPVYIGNTYSQGPTLVERHWSLLPWFWINAHIAQAIGFVQTMFDEDAEPLWPITITGKYDGEIPD